MVSIENQLRRLDRRMTSLPVLLIIYDRFDTTEQVLKVLQLVQPPRLYLASDAGHQPQVHEAVLKCRELTEARVNWPCEVKTRYLVNNEGPRFGVGGAITWFFEQEPQGLVLEHDCVPLPEFFDFCEHYLEKLKDDHRVFHIGGNNYLPDNHPAPAAYLSRYNHIWGFASWSRAWKHYDVELTHLEAVLAENWVTKMLPNVEEREYWFKRLRLLKAGEVRSWDYPWTLAMWRNEALALLPGANMVRNVGFGEQSLHSKDSSHPLNHLHISSLPKSDWPPTEALSYRPDLDWAVFRHIYRPPFWLRAIRKWRARA